MQLGGQRKGIDQGEVGGEGCVNMIITHCMNTQRTHWKMLLIVCICCIGCCDYKAGVTLMYIPL